MSLPVAWSQTEEGFLQEQTLRFETKLTESVQELRDLNQSIAAQKRPLLLEVNKVRGAVTRERHEVESLLLSKAEARQALEIAREDVLEREQHVEYAESLLGDYLNGFETRLNISEDQQYRDRLSEIRVAVDSGSSMATEEGMELRFEILDTAVDRLGKLLGGNRFAGKAVDGSGNLVNGDFLLLGPNAFFLSEDRKLAGLSDSEANSLEPVVREYEEVTAEDLAAALNDGESAIALDGTLGKAASIQAARWSLDDHVKKGGYVGYAIICFAGLALIISLVKVFDFMSFGKAPSVSVESLLATLKKGDVEATRTQAQSAGTHYGGIVASALENKDEEDAVVEDVVIGEIQKARLRLDRFLPFLAITAATTPLMGLLGTVVGMIKTFALITVFGSGEAKSLSSGISEALVTTEFGLLVAIPALLLHGAFVRLSKERVGYMEDFAADFLVGLKKMKGKGSGES